MDYVQSGLTEVIFSWSLGDILNNDVYRNKVDVIPMTFSSVEHYLNSFINPIIEETHADLCSAMKDVSQAPTCEVRSLAKSKGHNPKKMLYDIMFDQDIESSRNKREMYTPQSGDVILLSNEIPANINHLKRSPKSFVLGIVAKKEEGNKIRTSKAICDLQGKGSLYAIYLVNAVTNIRIWKALKPEKRKSNLDIFKEVLTVKTTIEDSCDVCSSQEIFGTHRLLHFGLNDSQINAISTCIATSSCTHKNSVSLIWGPPGTGKTKTVATLLWVLLKMRFTTITCAPTNIAVKEVTSRLLRLVLESHENDCYGLGDIVLFGNYERMKIDDHDGLFDVFLDKRAEILNDCFSRLTGWSHQLSSMIRLLEDPKTQYLLYLENAKKVEEVNREKNHGEENKQEKNNKKGKQKNVALNVKRCRKKKKLKAKGSVQNKNQYKGKNEEQDLVKKEESSEEVEIHDNLLSFLDFFRKQFGCIENVLKFCIVNLRTHLPTSIISKRIAENMSIALKLLESLRNLLHRFTLTRYCGDLENITSLSSFPVLNEIVKECLQTLTSLRGAFSLPDIYTKGQIKNFCLRNACLVFCTASSSARLLEVKPFELLIIDEAAQLKECESAIPLQLRSVQHAILIGDEKQLPAMIKSKISEKCQLGRSLFERLAQLGKRKHLLNIQYRMHPSISLFPNSELYSKQISDAPSVKEESYRKNLLPGNMYGPYSFINVAYGKEELDDGYSWRNMVEVVVICEIVECIYKASVDTRQIVSVGVISPYNAQVVSIQKRLGVKYSNQRNFSVSVRSIDGFQGGEKDVIIMSTVRSNEDGSVGFLSNLQRMNVALTRARYFLWILGNGATLTKSDSVWKKLVLDAQHRGCYFDADKDYRLTKAIVDSLIKLNQTDELFHRDSILFKGARWKVIFDDGFWKSVGCIKNVDVRKKLASLSLKLLTGWRYPPEKQRSYPIMDGSFSIPLEQYNIDGHLNLLWTVDIMKEGSKLIQVLKLWDILKLQEVPRLRNHLNAIFGSYTMDCLNRCKFRCYEGKLEVPMTWEISSDAVIPGETNTAEHFELSSQLASLNLGHGSRKSAPNTRKAGKKLEKRRRNQKKV